ncbi:MAG: transglycosylase domain-containing protein [Candidatus Dormibacteraeota bacterium]|nr:transglycosylase domain-containing protein [Candidatus Dormibacteraeota bacterium]
MHAAGTPLGRRRTRRALFRTGAVGLAALLALVIAGDAYATSLMDSLPDVRNLDAAAFRGDTVISDRGGVQLADVGRDGDHRRNVTLDQVSPSLINATVAVEDQTFWTNPGVSPEAVARAGLADVTHGSIVGGGSTITQQLAKQQFLTADQTLSRKARELALAYQLSQTYSKRQILELYLNKNNYGEQQYGVQAASETYFQKPAAQLDTAQSALLAGLPQSPSLYDPVKNLANAKARQQQVLEAMVRTGYISTDQSRAAYLEPVAVHAPVNTSLAPHFVDYVLSELQALGLHVGTQQLIVKTTLDWGKQQLAENVVRSNLKANQYRDRSGQLSSAMVAEDPRTGQIVAYVGSPNINAPGGNYDFVSGTYVNPGSSLKPFTYAAAIDARRITMDTPINDFPAPLLIPAGPGYGPTKLYDYERGHSLGTQPARVALAGSLNIPAVKVEMATGIANVYSYYRGVGLNLKGIDGNVNGPPDDYGPTLTLGDNATHLLDEVGAYGVLADLGLYHPAESILQVTDPRGRVLYSADPSRGARQAMNPGTAFIIDSLLTDDNNRAPVFGHGSPLHMSDRQSAAKSGTTESFKDALTAGLTPDLVSVFWVGDIFGETHTMSSGSDGVFVAAPAWNKFMTEALRGVPDHWYEAPTGVVKSPTGGSWYLQDATSIPALPGDLIPAAATGAPATAEAAPPDPGTGAVPVADQQSGGAPGPPACRFPIPFCRPHPGN